MQALRILRLDELVVRRPRDDAAAERRDRRRTERAADRTRCVDVALGAQRVAGRHHLTAHFLCNPLRGELVDVGDEHACPGLREVVRQVVPDGPDALHEHAAPVEVGRAEDVLDARADPVQHTARCAVAAVAAVRVRAEHPPTRLGDDVEVVGRDVHVACGVVRAAE